MAAPAIIQPFQPHPWQIAPWRDRSPILLLTGGGGGGKSTLALEKPHAYCLKYPGATWLLLRKTRASMTNSTTLFFERSVIGADPRVTHYPSKYRFEYTNGSIVAYGGMADEEQREAIRSIGQTGGIDGVTMEEANAFEESDFNELILRMRGMATERYYFAMFCQDWLITRRAKAIPPEIEAALWVRAKGMGWRQMILATNPDSPLHWIYTRLIVGEEAKVYYSKHTDNPSNPDSYAAGIQSLTGIEALRLGEGQWVQASGRVYDTFVEGDGGNVTTAAEYIPGAGDIVAGIDDGYSPGSAKLTNGMDPKTGLYVATAHPRVFLAAQLKPDGHIDIFYEHYACQMQSEDHIQLVLDEWEAMRVPEPEWFVLGPGFAELRGRVNAMGFYTRFCSATVAESIKVARGMLAADANGWRRIRIHPRCKNLRAELATNAWQLGAVDKPIKAFDHGPDVLRYMADKVKNEL